jgi:large subunit ribosomal protein L4
MAQLPLKDDQNQALKNIEGSDQVFAEDRRVHAVFEATRYQRAKRQRGTHAAKTRSFILRTSAKPYAQKGTGRARRGDVRAPGLTGGGVVFPPHPRSHAFSLPKNVRKVAVRSVLSDKLRHGKLTVLADHGIKDFKTKQAQALCRRLGVSRALFILGRPDEFFEKSMRNLPQVKSLRVEGVNAYDLLKYEEVVILQEALPLLEKRFQE